jgi:hypothetical protein
LDNFKRALHNTLVNIANEYMGSQSVLFVGSVVKDGQRTLASNNYVHMGFTIDPCK